MQDNQFQGQENCENRGNSAEIIRKVPFQNKEIIVLHKFHIKIRKSHFKQRKPFFKRDLERNGRKSWLYYFLKFFFA